MPVLPFRTVLGTGKHQETQGFQGFVPFVRAPIKSQKELFILNSSTKPFLFTDKGTKATEGTKPQKR
jgi:hypothetical protein